MIGGGGKGLKPIAALLAAALAAVVLASCATTPTPRAGGAAVEDAWGIRILGIRQSAAGYMLDFRYRVVDAAKAAPVFDRRVKPYLVDQESGARFMVPNPPKTGPLRTSDRPQQGRNYFMFFANPGRYVGPGSLVTVVVGDLRVENLVVQ